MDNDKIKIKVPMLWQVFGWVDHEVPKDIFNKGKKATLEYLKSNIYDIELPHNEVDSFGDEQEIVDGHFMSYVSFSDNEISVPFLDWKSKNYNIIKKILLYIYNGYLVYRCEYIKEDNVLTLYIYNNLQNFITDMHIANVHLEDEIKDDNDIKVDMKDDDFVIKDARNNQILCKLKSLLDEKEE